MARPAIRAWWVISLLVLVALGYWLATRLTWKEETVERGYSDTALRDDYLAAAGFLEPQGIDARTLGSFAVLDRLSWQGEPLGRQDTLILVDSYKAVRGKRLEQLLSWVESGGTAIVSTQNPFIGIGDSPDPLLESFGLVVDEEAEQREETAEGEEQPEEQAKEQAEEQVDEEEAPDPDGYTRSERCNLHRDPLAMELDGDRLRVDYSLGRVFDAYGDLPDYWAGTDWGLHLAAFDYGRGRFIVNSDNRIWENRRIDCHDHAYLLWTLINPRGQVWFLVNRDSPSLWYILRQASPLGVWAALLALALWLWSRAVRFGPVLTRTAEGRRSLAEHIRASAQLLWRRRQHPHLVTLLRRQLQRDIQKHWPGFAHWDRDRQLSHLTQWSGLTPEVIRRALYAPNLQHPHDFTQAVACLQTLRKHL